MNEPMDEDEDGNVCLHGPFDDDGSFAALRCYTDLYKQDRQSHSSLRVQRRLHGL